jgi:hypothetical protein
MMLCEPTLSIESGDTNTRVVLFGHWTVATSQESGLRFDYYIVVRDRRRASSAPPKSAEV